MNRIVPSQDLEDVAPATLRSPPSSLTVRDVAVVVEEVQPRAEAPTKMRATRRWHADEDHDVSSSIPTRTYARVA